MKPPRSKLPQGQRQGELAGGGAFGAVAIRPLHHGFQQGVFLVDILCGLIARQHMVQPLEQLLAEGGLVLPAAGGL